MLADTFIVDQLLEEASQRWGIWNEEGDRWWLARDYSLGKVDYVAVFVNFNDAECALRDAVANGMPYQGSPPPSHIRPIALSDLLVAVREDGSPVTGYVVFYDLAGTMEYFDLPEGQG